MSSSISKILVLVLFDTAASLISSSPHVFLSWRSGGDITMSGGEMILHTLPVQARRNIGIHIAMMQLQFLMAPKRGI
jgi:hypothetical protein